MRPTRLARSSAFRNGLLYAALFGACTLLLFGLVYWQTVGYMQGQLRALVDSDVHALLAHYRDDGLAGLQGAIADRLEGNRTSATHYLLIDAQGQRIAGDLPASVSNLGWSTRSVIPVGASGEDGDEAMPMLARGVNLAHGARLVVAQDAHQLAELRTRLAYALVWGLGLMVLLGAAAGALLGGAALRRVEGINRVVSQIMGGELSRRIPTRGRGDEFDSLATHLNRMLERIEQLMQGMREVSSDIAHDLRTPLGRLRHSLEAAQREAASVVDYRRAVAHAIEQTDQILETFAALLRIAQIESGSRRARFARVDLSQLAQTLVETYAPVADEGGRVLKTHIEPGVYAYGDRDLLMQALANLIENALTHTPAGSQIEIALKTTPDAVMLSVADDGPGIPQAALGKVTQRFYRLEASRSAPGSGLGLSLVAAVAELHGIPLELSDNRPGLRATIRLPRNAPSR